MTENTIELTRRKVLASVGAVGAAGAGVGMGTSALFSDEEGFEDNTITAGTLDLKVDWEEHYSYPQVYGFGDPTTDLAVSRAGPENLDSPVAFPPGVEANTDLDPLLWVEGDDVPAYMDATAIEAFPDADDDGVQDDLAEYDACTDFADVPSDLDPGGLRTDNADTRTDEEIAAPLVSLSDVKPGDFGEVTLSAHLCDNAGYLWLTAGDVTASENGLTEPESDADAEVEGEVELLDEIQTAWWYDTNCNNLTDGGTGGTSEEVDVVIVLDESGSMDDEAGKFPSAKDGAKALTDEVLSNAGTQVGLVSFESDAFLRQGLTTNATDVKNAVDALSAGGGTDFSDALDAGREELTGSDVSSIAASGNHRSGAQKVMVFLSNGSSGGSYQTEADAVKNTPAELYGIAYGSGADDATLQDIASDPDSQYFFDAPSQSEVETAFDDIGGQISGPGEEVFFQGDLRTALGALTSGDGIPLDGDGGDDFDELGDDPSAESRGCFEGNTTTCLGFSWWVPTDVGNQIQSDSVEFDLGFYTEQCRNNDGGGPDDTSTPAST